MSRDEDTMTMLRSRILTRASVGIGALAVAAAAPVGLGIAPVASAQPARPAPASIVTTSQVVPSADAKTQLITAEAPNGDIAIAVPASAVDDDIDLARAGHAPVLFDTVPHGTVALAFSHADLFLAGKSALSSVKRSTGNFVRTWGVKVASPTGPGQTMVYGDGRLWVIGNAGSGRRIFEINPASAAIRTVASGRNIESIAAGPRGVYFVPSGGRTLVRVSAARHSVSAPTHEHVNTTLSGPGAVHVITVDGSQLIVAHDAGQGLDSAIVRFSAGSLARLGEAGTSVALTDIVPTRDGNGVLMSGPGQGGCSDSKPCVATISTPTAATSARHRLPGHQALSGLMGPDPAIVVGSGSHARLLRLSAL